MDEMEAATHAPECSTDAASEPHAETPEIDNESVGIAVEFMGEYSDVFEELVR